MDFTATSTTLPTETSTPRPSRTPAPTPTHTPDYFSQEYSRSEIEYVIPLTVRHAPQGKAIFYFELEKPSVGKLVYRNLETRIQGEFAFSTEANQQMMTVEGLIPGMEYEADIILGTDEDGFQRPGFEKESWGSIHFRSNSDEWPLRIGVLGDASFGDSATQNLVKEMAMHNLDFVIHTGDVVYEIDGSDPIQSYAQKYFQPFAPLLHQGPIYSVLGNHDYDSTLRMDGVPTYDYVFPPFPNPTIRYPETRRGQPILRA